MNNALRPSKCVQLRFKVSNLHKCFKSLHHLTYTACARLKSLFTIFSMCGQRRRTKRKAKIKLKTRKHFG